MYQAATTVINKTGLHARPAASFVAAAAKFKSNIRVKNLKTGKENNAKSMIMLMSLAITQGTKVELIAEGPDEQEAVQTLIAMIEGGFGEV